MQRCYLVLENGERFEGWGPTWQKGPYYGEVVFTTGMTGYPETLTDPSFTGQILVFTYPLIGNYGIPPETDWESSKVHASGVIVTEACRAWSHFNGTASLLQWLENQGVPLMTGVDTRMLTKILRGHGTLNGAIASKGFANPAFFDPNTEHLVAKASQKREVAYGCGKKIIVAIDCGMKEGIVRCMEPLPVTIRRVPYDYDFTEEKYDGIFISNGPGDPIQCRETISILKKALEGNKPIFGICLGAQLLALAAGGKTYKLSFGHRGQNQPCMDTETGKCYITSQNHGFAVDESSLPKSWKVTFRNLNDHSVEGIAHRSKPFFAVQFHPEAAPGPTETRWLFDKFYAALSQPTLIGSPGFPASSDRISVNQKETAGAIFNRGIASSYCRGENHCRWRLAGDRKPTEEAGKPTRKKPLKKVLILGSGGLRIGQAGEFDYSGSQAIKALKEEGLKTVLINPNIATVQTDKDMADTVYLQPINIETIARIIEKEKPDGILLSVGGQTALNIGLKLEELGILQKHAVQVLGTPTKTIRLTEDRELFKQALEKIAIKTPVSIPARTVQEAVKAAIKIGYPLMMRSGYSLGGLGSGRITSEEQLRTRASEALHAAPQILIEEYLSGWKEIEYEIVRDKSGNTITVCNMENLDPMGIHTGESIVVAPSQTLTNEEFHKLREIAIRTAESLGIVGECNIQYALNPKNGDYRVIEMNARLSRSSALASKATGYPLAFVSTKLSLGKNLHEIKNSITQKTTAFFEPALDYLVVKVPRWDIQKLKSAEHTIGSEMKSVGEVMAIGRSFPEALQKAIRMLNLGASGLLDYPYPIPNAKDEIAHATDRRLFAIATSFAEGASVQEIHRLSHIDPWFLTHIKSIVDAGKTIPYAHLTPDVLLNLKQLGFSDKTIAALRKTTEAKIRNERIQQGIKPIVKQIDTLAGEFNAETRYLYTTYHGSRNDLTAAEKPPVIVLGSGPYCIGSSVEFDWCAVNTARTLRKHRENTIMINSNPETVSTDYDESDRLYFEEVTFERVCDIADFENPKGIIVSVGGQIANNLAMPLYQAGYPLLGTSAPCIDQAENRQKFSTLLNRLGIDQPRWEEVTTLEKAEAFAKRVGYPVLVRPSYVLSGAAMNMVFSENELKQFLDEATLLSPEHPVVISQFIKNAKELEIDGVADRGKVVLQAISEHIENAGIHSGDATIVIPPQRLYLETIRKAKKITSDIVNALEISGPFNIQFIALDNAIKVIECNVRAARSFPFVSKVCNCNFIEEAVKVILGKHRKRFYETLELDYVGVKTAQFSYSRLKGANPVAHVEMASTGEVASLGNDLKEAFYNSWLSTEQTISGKRILASIGGDKKIKLLAELKKLEELGWDIFSTENTHDFLTRNGVASTFLYKASQELNPNVATIIVNKEVDLIINIPRSLPMESRYTDGYKIRRLAIDHEVPLITNLQIARLFLRCLIELNLRKIPVKSWQEYVLRK